MTPSDHVTHADHVTRAPHVTHTCAPPTADHASTRVSPAGHVTPPAAHASTRVWVRVVCAALLLPLAPRIGLGLLVLWGAAHLWGGDDVWGRAALWGREVLWGRDDLWGRAALWGREALWGRANLWGRGTLWGRADLWGREALWVAMGLLWGSAGLLWGAAGPLWVAVGQWNAYFDAMLYTNSPALKPLALLVREMVVEAQGMNESFLMVDANVASSSVRAATIVVSLGPILLVYPFLQKYFASGIALGAVKG